ncbi:unnamed protein product [Moneuplotes crassus]|uniref:Uncharacterized protein n=1 Tax=Euplotes crassus TaxID=5936 RepID=A0AAD1U1Q7_EUPCR|nr:unnamed protein product [Moneuplotes crassus]
MLPKGRTKRNNCMLFAFIVFLITFFLFLDAFLKVKKIQYEAIEDYVTRMAASQLSIHADYIASMNTVDMQEIFREITIISTVMSIAILNKSYISHEFLQYSKQHKMISNSEYISLEEELVYPPDDEFMSYLIFPQKMDYSKLEHYHPAEKEVELCAFIEYYVEWILHEPLLQMNKTLIFIGFYTELFCEYAASNIQYYRGPPIEKEERHGYNFEKDEQVFFPSIRKWFDKGIKESGLTTFVGTYVWAGHDGKIGSTLSQAFLDTDSSILGVIGFDLIPYSKKKSGAKYQESNNFSMFGEDSSNQKYFITSKSNVLNQRIYNIASDLARSVYSEHREAILKNLKIQNGIDNSTSSQTGTCDRFTNMQFFELENFQGESQHLMSYTFCGVARIICFEEIELLGQRLDNSSKRSAENMVGLIFEQSRITDYIRIIHTELLGTLVVSNIIIILFCCFLASIVIILSIRKISDKIRNQIVDMCIRMKIVQMNHKRMSQLNYQHKRIEFLHYNSKASHAGTGTNFSEIFRKAEIILTVYNLKHFELRENNPEEYTQKALQEFEQIAITFEDFIEASLEKGNDEDKLDKLYTQLFKCKNNIGVLYFSLKQYEKAEKIFCELRDHYGYRTARDDYLSMTKLSLNSSVNLIKMIENKCNKKFKENSSKVNIRKEIIRTTFYLNSIIKTQSKKVHNNEIELMARILLIQQDLVLKNYDKCEDGLKTFKNIIRSNYEFDRNDNLLEFCSQNRLYLKACFMIDLFLCNEELCGCNLRNKILQLSSRLLCAKCSSGDLEGRQTIKKIRYSKTILSAKSLEETDSLFYIQEALLCCMRVLYIFERLDPDILKQTLHLLGDYYYLKGLISPQEPNEKVMRTLCFTSSQYLNSHKRWNVLISYNPKLAVEYHEAGNYLEEIKQCLEGEDIISLYRYTSQVHQANYKNIFTAAAKQQVKHSLKCIVDKKFAKNISFKSSLFSGLLTTGNDFENFNKSNFLNRFCEFLKAKHHKTNKRLTNKKYRNLVIAFTHIDEWQEKEEIESFLDVLRLERRQNELQKNRSQEQLKAAIIIIVFHNKVVPKVDAFSSFKSEDRKVPDQKEIPEWLTQISQDINLPISVISCMESDQIKLDSIKHFIHLSRKSGICKLNVLKSP